MSDCQHEDFHATVAVGRLTKEDGGPVTSYVADITVKCTQCGLPFQFLGLSPGYDNQGSTVSLDGLEARLALTPQGKKPNPLQRLAYNITKYT